MELQNFVVPPDAMPAAWPDKQCQEQRFVESSPGFSPMSMELTNDTLQMQQDGGSMPFMMASTADNDSLTLSAAPGKDGILNITESLPGLSTLVEEDEEAYMESADTAGQPDNDGTAMELTGMTAGYAAGRVGTSQYDWQSTITFAVALQCQ